jgi:putative FmdB family regulatory protein
MPIYEYHCSDCGENFSALVFSQKDRDELACPKCQSRALDKLMSAASVAMAPSAAPASCPSGADPASCPYGSCGCH